MPKHRFIAFSILLATLTGATSNAQDLDALQQRIDSTIREMGVVESASSTEIRCPLPGQSVILRVVDEGTQVVVGDALATFDTANLREELEQLQLGAEQIEAALVAAEKESKLLQDRGQVLEGIAKQRRAVAKLDAEAAEAELTLERREAEGEVRVQQAAVAAATAEIDQWRRSHSDQEAPPSLQLERVAAEERLAAAERRGKHLSTVALERSMAAARLRLAEMESQWNSEQSAFQRQLAAAAAKLQSAQAEYSVKRLRVAELKALIAKGKVVASQPGMVVYPTSRSSRSGGSQIEAGASVREAQPVLRLADLSQLQVRTRVNETRIARVRTGQSATITLDAAPHSRLQGEVVEVARIPRPQSFLSGDVKEYDVIVRIKAAPDTVRLGMTGMVELRLDRK